MSNLSKSLNSTKNFVELHQTKGGSSTKIFLELQAWSPKKAGEKNENTHVNWLRSDK